ncbi:YoaK family protein [Paeniglutamicibacter terrestris]|nr:YoaK family protein [Paeniglutamicibacter terrestris]
MGRKAMAYAGGLTAIAGFIDGVAFIHFGGYFVSFMSGNSTRSSAELARGNFSAWAMAIALVICFVFGVAAATLASNVPSVHRRGAVLSVSSFFLLAAALTALGPASFFTALLLSTSMGAINATYTRRGEVSVGLTYMTGALVKMGQHLAAALVGGPKWAWLPYGALWIMITIGSFVGALVYLRLGLLGLWIAVAALLVWTVVAFVRDSPERIFRAS